MYPCSGVSRAEFSQHRPTIVSKMAHLTSTEALRETLTENLPYCSGTLASGKPQDFLLYYGKDAKLG